MPKPIDYAALELKLRRIVERRLEEGWDVKGGHGTFAYGGQCCLLGAVAIDAGGEHSYEGAEKALGIENYLDIECGFEGWGCREDRRLCAIGARIRRDYCEWTNA